jgi:CBS domain-containing protein
MTAQSRETASENVFAWPFRCNDVFAISPSCAVQNDRRLKFFSESYNPRLFCELPCRAYLEWFNAGIRSQNLDSEKTSRGRRVLGGGEAAMTVKAILDSKGTDVAIIQPAAELASAVKLLAARRIGALVVVGPDHRVAGIISERDVIRVLAEHGAAALEKPVGQVMTRKVVTCNRAETMSGVMERMTAGKFRHLPVVEEDQLIGIISIGDVVKYRVQQIEFESAALRDYIRTA